MSSSSSSTSSVATSSRAATAASNGARSTPSGSGPTVTYSSLMAAIQEAVRKEVSEAVSRALPAAAVLSSSTTVPEAAGGESSASTTDQNIVADLRTHDGAISTCYEAFWDKCNHFLNKDIGIAVDDSRHGQVTHLACAISIRDFTTQVLSRCPEGTAIPSEEWVRLQFWPKNPTQTVSLQNTGRFNLKFMVQQQQWRQSHPNAHYVAAYFRYMRKYALRLCSLRSFICLDDKYKIKIGETDYPVVSAVTGKIVSDCNDETLAVGDHDFTKFSIVQGSAFSDVVSKVFAFQTSHPQ
uniref:Uncharacterized protein n=1 Tax=Amphimedon queenslandica TaxID=400682 RepID=A0A1X7U8A1_AMPQE